MKISLRELLFFVLFGMILTYMLIDITEPQKPPSPWLSINKDHYKRGLIEIHH